MELSLFHSPLTFVPGNSLTTSVARQFIHEIRNAKRSLNKQYLHYTALENLLHPSKTGKELRSFTDENKGSRQQL